MAYETEIIELIDELVLSMKKYITNNDDISSVLKAIDLAIEKHDGQLRKSGEPYVIHPLKVANILTGFQTGPATIISGILHDVVEDTDTPIEYIEEMFGADVASIVDGVTKISQYKYKSKAKAIAETHQKLIIATSKDIRVIVVKLADRLHNMRTIEYVPKEKRTRICRETLEIYAPIAHRLGMYRLKAEMEDLCFKNLDEQAYNDVAKSLQESKEERDEALNSLISEIKLELDKSNISFKIKGRTKNIYSIHRKMSTKGKDFREIYDLLALRIIVDSLKDCYEVLGMIHAKFKPVSNRFKDYIAVPKINMYQSLHTTIMTNYGIFEVQIRTKEMDEVAEKGIAAHWAYKEGVVNTNEREEIRKQNSWYNAIIQLAEDDNVVDTEEFIDTIKEDLTASVFIFTPTGDVFMLPQGSTPVDFAFRIHTEVGLTCVGAIVNNKMVPLNYQLKTNDIVAIKTSKTSKGPNDDWLQFVKTSQARSKIRSFINQRDYDIIVEDGKRKFEEIHSQSEKLSLSDDLVKKMMDNPDFQTLDDMYHNIGKNVISARSAYNKLVGKREVTEEEIIEKIQQKSSFPKTNNAHGLVVEGLQNPLIRLSNCCNPIPGDSIVGYVSKGLGIAVHRENCPNVSQVDKNRLLNVYWSTSNSHIKYRVNLRILTFIRQSILQEIVSVLATNNASIQKYHAVSLDNDTNEIRISIETHNLESTEKIIANILKVKDVIDVERVVI